MRKIIKKLIRESLLGEKLIPKNWDEYAELVTNAYTSAPKFDTKVVKHWNSLNTSNYTLFKRLLSKVNVVFTTNDKSKIGSVDIVGRTFKIEYLSSDDEYKTQSEMKNSFNQTGILKISCDNSTHPIFSVTDNIVFRTVHDYIVHILGNHDFGLNGEIASYNQHAKLAPNDAIPALFTEVVGQVCVTIKTGNFPEQKIAILNGFDYNNVGVIDDTDYEIIDKTLVKKNTLIKKDVNITRTEPIAIQSK